MKTDPPSTRSLRSGIRTAIPPNAPSPQSTDRPKPPPREDRSGSLGVQGLVRELVSALESSFNRFKLTVAAVAGFALGIGVMILTWVTAWFDAPWTIGSALAIVLLMLAAYSLMSVLVTRCTFIELSRMRPPRSHEIRTGLAGRSIRLFTSLLVIAGIIVIALAGVRRLPEWALTPSDSGHPASDWLVAPFLALSIVGHAIAWPLLALTLLLSPILVIEDCSIWKGVVEWFRLLRRHLGRLLTYEAMAVALGLLIASPFVLPVVISAWYSAGLGALPVVTLVRQATLAMLGGIALAPFLAYMVVANAYIYLHVKYEFSQSAR